VMCGPWSLCWSLAISFIFSYASNWSNITYGQTLDWLTISLLLSTCTNWTKMLY
jgi:hypothetical protein